MEVHGRQPRKVTVGTPEELSASVASAYNRHTLRMDTGLPIARGRLWVRGAKDLSIIDLSYGAHVFIVPEPFCDFYLVTSTLRGRGCIRSGAEEVSYAPNQTILLSADRPFSFQLDPDFKQRSVRISREHLHRFVSQWTGKPVTGAIDFQLRPFSAVLNERWVKAVQLLDDHDNGPSLPPIARARLIEFLLALLVESHPHGHADDMTRDRRTAPRIVRRAEELMRAKVGEKLSMVDIAVAVGCSVRSLQAGFRATRGVTPSEYLNSIRLDRARMMMVQAAPGTTVTEVALNNGFTHMGRFSAAFAARFGERPASLLKRRSGQIRY